jgi:hypothetical protein
LFRDWGHKGMLKCSSFAITPFVVLVAYIVISRVAMDFFAHHFWFLDRLALISCSISSIAIPIWGVPKRIFVTIRMLFCLIFPPVYFFVLLFLFLILHMAFTGDGI